MNFFLTFLSFTFCTESLQIGVPNFQINTPNYEKEGFICVRVARNEDKSFTIYSTEINSSQISIEKFSPSEINAAIKEHRFRISTELGKAVNVFLDKISDNKFENVIIIKDNETLQNLYQEKIKSIYNQMDDAIKNLLSDKNIDSELKTINDQIIIIENIRICLEKFEIIAGIDKEKYKNMNLNSILNHNTKLNYNDKITKSIFRLHNIFKAYVLMFIQRKVLIDFATKSTEKY